MTTTNAFVTDKIRCWYYSGVDNDNQGSLALGYGFNLISDARQTRTANGDFALVIAKVYDADGVKYLAHVSVVTDAGLDNPKETFLSVWGRNGLQLPHERTSVHRVVNLTRIHDITDYIKTNNVEMGQAGVEMKDREGLLQHLLIRG